MTVESDYSWQDRLTLMSQVAGYLVMGGAILVLVGWWLDVDVLKSLVPGYKPMSIVSAVTFIAAGSALLLWNASLVTGTVSLTARLLSVFMIFVGFLSVMNGTIEGGAGLDPFLVWGGDGAVRMAPSTAVGFVLLGLAMALTDIEARSRGHLVEILVIPSLLIALHALLGYVYRISPICLTNSFIPMSLPSAILLLALSLGLVFARPRQGLISLVARDADSGRMARRLLLGSIAILLVLGWLRLEGERRGLYSSEFGLALFMQANILIFGVLIFWNAKQIAKGERERAEMDAALLKARDELELRVEERTRDLAQVVGGLSGGIAMLAEVARDVTIASEQMSTGAAGAATAVAQTATTVEQVRQTARMTTQDAGQVAESAAQAARISQAGRKSTEETVATMQRIRAEMDAIAESMARLNDQTQAIGQIVTTVNALAAQSNLLAVNAAIEAAKAGERGKGFAVVAQEVKTLADQSRRATHQIGVILNDIQNATRLSVLATEHGRKAVESGVNQSVQTGNAIDTLAASVGAAAEAAAHIANASQQQLVGVDQVAVAMSSIKQTTSHSLTMVRQLEVAALHLSEVGQKLQQLVVHYKVPEA